MCEIAILDPDRYSYVELSSAAMEVYNAMGDSLGLVGIVQGDDAYKFEVYKATKPSAPDVNDWMQGVADDAERILIHGRLATQGACNIQNSHPDATNWYKDVIEHVEEEHNRKHQPVGLMKGSSTAGLHIHLSSLSRSQARELYEISQTPWAKVLFCSSIAMDNESATWPVFRGGSYCRMNFDSSGRYDCINSRGNGHYEWRMPEPMIGDHMEILVKFLRLFEESPDMAREYAQEVLDDGDDRITAIRRAEAVGMDIDGVPTVERDPYPETEDFFEEVSDEWAAPEIYRVNHDDGVFYLFESRIEDTFEVNGVEFSRDDVLLADSLDRIEDDELRDDITRAYQRHGHEEIRETEATNELKKIVKKKKS